MAKKSLFILILLILSVYFNNKTIAQGSSTKFQGTLESATILSAISAFPHDKTVSATLVEHPDKEFLIAASNAQRWGISKDNYGKKCYSSAQRESLYIEMKLLKCLPVK